MEPINNEIEKKENKNEDLKKNKSNSSLPISNSSQKVLPASLSCRDIKQTANIQDTSPNDNDAFSKRESVSAEPKNAFEKKIIDMINSLIELYYEKISYKRESVIILLLLLPLPLLAVSFPLLDKLVFTNSTYGFGFKIITIFVGLIAIYGIDIINKRHAQLSHIVKIINGEGTIRSICDSIKGKGKNRPLAWTAAELSITAIPQGSYYGDGLSIEADLTNASQQNASSDSNVFQTSAGAQWGCFKCVGLKTNDILLVPVSSKLIDTNSLNKKSEVVMQSVQDVVSLDVSCFIVTPRIRAKDENLQFSIVDFNYGVRTAFLDFEITAFDTAGNLHGRRCALISRDWSGLTKVRYDISETGSTARASVDYVGAVYSNNCTVIGDSCLNEPLHSNISLALIRSSFPTTTFSLNQVYSKNFHMFPDPTQSFTDADYAERVANAIGMNFLLITSQFSNNKKTVSLETDTLAVKLRVQSWISILTIISAIVCVLVSALLIVADVIKLGKASNVLLRRLSFIIQPGKPNIEAISQYVFDILKDGAPSDDWDLMPIRFGEDRLTMHEPLGRLRFGGKKDVVRFKQGRAYF